MTLLTLDRLPINPLDRDALDELPEVLREVEVDPETRVVVIASGIPGIFSSGGNSKYWRGLGDARTVSEAGREVFRWLEWLSKPTLAAINGHVIGDGLALALACDLRIASETAAFRVPEVGHGFIPGSRLIHRLVAQVGRVGAAELLLTGQPLGLGAPGGWRPYRRRPSGLPSAPSSAAMRGRASRPSGAAQIGRRASVRCSPRGLQSFSPEGREVAAVISLDEFRRIDLRVGEILAAECVPGSDRLMRLTVDLAGGLAQIYAPKELRGLKVVVAANLSRPGLGGSGLRECSRGWGARRRRPWPS